MVMLVMRVWCFQGLVLALLGLPVLPCTNLRRRGKCQDLSLLLQFEMLPSALLVLNFMPADFDPTGSIRDELNWVPVLVSLYL